jgi:hypothetical protein
LANLLSKQRTLKSVENNQSTFSEIIILNVYISNVLYSAFYPESGRNVKEFCMGLFSLNHYDIDKHYLFHVIKGTFKKAFSFHFSVPNTYTTVTHGGFRCSCMAFHVWFPHFRNPTRPSDSADEAAEDAQVHEKRLFWMCWQRVLLNYGLGQSILDY